LSHRQEYLCYGMRFYRPLPALFPALQLVWTDKSGLMPCQQDYDPGMSPRRRPHRRTCLRAMEQTDASRLGAVAPSVAPS
jgi:hypothetical protein